MKFLVLLCHPEDGVLLFQNILNYALSYLTLKYLFLGKWKSCVKYILAQKLFMEYLLIGGIPRYITPFYGI